MGEVMAEAIEIATVLAYTHAHTQPEYRYSEEDCVIIL